jgi:hypothetical protein
MKHLFYAVVVMFCATLVFSAEKPKAAEKPEKPAAAAPGGEKYVLFKLYDMTKKVTLQVQSLSEFNKLKTQIADEEKYFARALSMVDREWTKDKENNKGSFPRSLVAPREIKEIDTFSSQDAADKKLTALQEKESKADEPRKAIPGVPGPPAKDPKKVAERQAKAAEKQAQAENIATMVDAKIQELMQAKPEAKPDAAKPDAKPDAAKK